ncbi:hypothetical protein EW146_g8211 [Bondarzewia mesenterica]|uniref:Uncharacterized protein n=1 Tax=Bondarzewia mesenterica TaxID=1095465 RepID=A0A4S4LGS3_9AGAM|nr:hypothetical protein EW146_g8211 [Bondarzewia mesenterica]
MSSSLSISPSIGPIISPLMPSRRVSSRRGSMSASDPWGAHTELNMNPSRATSSKLTIVRVNSPPFQLDDTPPSPQQRRVFGFGSHRRHGSSSSLGSSSSISGVAKPEGARLSFASASFAAPGSPTGTGSKDSNSRPTSPTLTRPRSPGGSGHRHAASSISIPRLSADQLVTLAHQSCNPHVASTPSQSPQLPGHSPVSAATSHASFTPLPDDIYLPFIDRAAEVSLLFSGPPDAKLLTLLAQTFHSTSAQDARTTDTPSTSVFIVDPKKWTFPQFDYWLKHVDRDVAPDALWVFHTRRCVLAHSELIWERMKGALGVPPELDIDSEDIDSTIMFSTFEFVPPSSQPMEVAAGLVTEGMAGARSSEPHFAMPTDRGSVSPEVLPKSLSPLSSGEQQTYSSDDLTIEPVFASTSPPTEHEHPPTRPGAHRMVDISEDVRETEEEDDSFGPALVAPSPPKEVVQGLRISTAAASPDLFASNSPSARPRSLSPIVPSGSLTSSNPRHISPNALDERDASLPAKDRDGDSVRRGSAGQYHYAASNASSDVPYDMVGERGPGNPLFPSSFARLALGPTLSANNPSLRSPTAPPPSAFSNPHAIQMGVRGRRAVPSWAEGWDPSKHEYAVSFASGDSVSGLCG